jgi:type IV secretion system protein TrbF
MGAQPHPYAAAWQPWDERYEQHLKSKRNWQIACGLSSLASVILAGGMVYQSTKARYIPFVVQVDRQGYALTLPEPLSPSSDPAMVDHMERYEIAAFIRNVRTISSDPAVQQYMLNRMFEHAGGEAGNFLDAYYHSPGRNPFSLGHQQTVTVTVNSILKLASNSWQVRWEEQAFDHLGSPLGAPRYWEAELTTELSTPDDQSSIINNPLGFKVIRIAWAEQQN